jgi:signal transduction histidine kinase
LKSRADAYARIIALFPEAALIVTGDGAIQVANARAAALLGVSTQEAAGRRLDEFVEDPSTLAGFMTLSARSATPVPAGVSFRRPAASAPARIEGAMLEPRSAEGPALILVRVRAKEAAIDRFLALNMRIEELGREIARRQRAEAALAETDRRKDEFLAMLAHELRNPLAVLTSGIGYMAASREPGTAGDGLLERMQRQLRQLTRLVDDLVDVARITTGKMVLRREPVPLQTVLRDALDACGPAIAEREIDLVAALPDEPVWVYADPARLPQVFSNLVSNAVKFSPVRASVRISAEVRGGQATVTVRDAGSGIRRELLASVFDLFTQADHSLARSLGGLGVGLNVAKRITELHGGTIEAHSEGEGLGSEFRVTLPRAGEPAHAQPKRPPSPPAPTAAKRRILVVDDNQDAAISLAALLRLSGHEVQVSYDGESALRLSSAMLPDVILLDLGMPGMSGYEVARRLRRSAAAKLPRIIALSGYGADADRLESRRAGFDHHLTKPVLLEALQSLID